MSWSTSLLRMKPPCVVKPLHLCSPKATRSRKRRRDSCFHNLNGYLLSFGEEDLRWPTDKVSTLIYKPRLTLSHLIPDAAQGIVGEELDDVAGREELVTNGELSTVAGCLRLGPHLSALFIAVEVLVHP